MIQLRRMCEIKTKKFLPFVFVGKNVKARMLMMFRTTRSIAIRSSRTFIQRGTPMVITQCLVFTPICKYINLLSGSWQIYTFLFMNYLLNLSAGVNCQKYIRGNIVSTKSCWGNMNHYWCKQDIFSSWYSLDASQYGSDLEWSVLSCLPFKQFWISNFYLTF